MSIRSNRVESTTFSTHLHSPPEDKIGEITMHEPSSFLKRGHKLQLIRTIRVNSIESTRVDNIFNPPSKSRANRLPVCGINRRGNDSCRFDGIGFTNRFPVCRIANTKDESTLVGCIASKQRQVFNGQILHKSLASILQVTRRLILI